MTKYGPGVLLNVTFRGWNIEKKIKNYEHFIIFYISREWLVSQSNYSYAVAFPTKTSLYLLLNLELNATTTIILNKIVLQIIIAGKVEFEPY